MRKPGQGLLVAVVVVACFGVAGAAEARDLTFDQRVAAQEALERIYYSHQIGATRPFAVAVPRDLLVQKVRTYLQETAALERLWRTPVTAGMLRAEMERMARQSRMPDRLGELFAALGNDPFLIEECLARPALVGRLARNFLDYDQEIHSRTRRAAERLRQDLVAGRIDPWSDRPGREVLEIARGARPPQKGAMAAGSAGGVRPTGVLDLSPEEFDSWSRRVPAQAGVVGALVEEQKAFVIRVLLEKWPDGMRVASYIVRKIDEDLFWRESAPALGEAAPAPVASAADPLPDLSASPCAPNDSWDNGSLSNIVDARAGHTAVWTGSLMIVWGGDNGAEGGDRYDPATDTWTPTSEPGFTVEKIEPTAVWTGSLMVVWGGNSLSTRGARYDPA